MPAALSANALNRLTASLCDPFAAAEVVAMFNTLSTSIDTVSATASSGAAALSGVTAGAATASKALVVDANADLTGLRDISMRDVAARNVDAGSSGTAGSVDIFPSTASKGKVSIVTAANSGDTTTTVSFAAQAGARTFTVPDPGASASLCALTGGQSSPGVLSRADFVQESAAVYPVPLVEGRTWDALATLLPATPLSDDLGLVTNTFGTGAPTIETGDLKTLMATTRYTRFQLVVPPEYVAGQAVTIRLNAGMRTTVANTTATIDVECYRQAAPTVDVCSTAAQSINSLSAANKDFTITPTNVVPGDVLDFRVAIAVNDSASLTAVIGVLYSVTVFLAIKG